MFLYKGSNNAAVTSGHGHLAAKSLLCLSILASASCVRYQPEPIDLNQVFEDWQKVDAAQASETVLAAWEAKGHQNDTVFDLKDGISLREAEITALFFNPSIRATRLQIGIPQAEAKYAKLWEDPGLNIDGEYVLDDVNEPLVLGAGLSITIPLSGRPALKKRLAQARITEKEASALGAEWALVNTVRQQWIEMASLSSKKTLLENAGAALEKLVAAADTFRAAQAITIVEQRLLRIQLKKTQAELNDVRALLAEQQQIIIATMGLYAHDDWKLLVQMPDAPKSQGVDNAFAVAKKHPQLRIALAAYNIAEQQLAYEVRKQYPDLSIGFGGGSDQGESRLAFGLGLFPIPMWNANKAGIASAQVERKIASMQVEQALKDLINRMFFINKQYQTITNKLKFYREEIAPLSQQQLLDAKRLAGLGQLDLFLLVDALEQSRMNGIELLDLEAGLVRRAHDLNALQSAPWNPSASENDDSLNP